MSGRTARWGSATRVLGAALVPSLLVLSMWVPAASASTSPQVTVGTGAYATLDEGEVGVMIRVAGRCSPGAVVVESFVYVNQDGFSSDQASLPLQCDQLVHRSVVLIPKGDAPLHQGAASVSAYALVMDPQSGETAQSDWARDITILP